jgi:small subunit ribosomal protein S15
MAKTKKTAKPAKEAKASKSVKEEKVEKVDKAEKVVEENTKSVKLPEDKEKVIEKFAQRKGDTGSPEVQVALLTHKIEKLSEHLDINKKDNHSRRGLLKVIAKRRRILNYLLKLDEKRYKKLIKELSLKK